MSNKSVKIRHVEPSDKTEIHAILLNGETPIYHHSFAKCSKLAEELIYEENVFIAETQNEAVALFTFQSEFNSKGKEVASSVVHIKEGCGEYRKSINELLEETALKHKFNNISIFPISHNEVELLKNDDSYIEEIDFDLINENPQARLYGPKLYTKSLKPKLSIVK